MQRFSLFGTVLLFSILGCGSDDESTKNTAKVSPPVAPSHSIKAKSDPPVSEEEAPVAATGVIRGIVKWEGKIVPAKPVVMAAGGFCHEFWRNKQMPLRERWKWGKNSTLQNVVVYVSGGLPTFTKGNPPRQPAELKLEGCMYMPHVQVVQVGQELRVLNKDQTYHTSYVLPHINEVQYFDHPVEGDSQMHVFSRAEAGIFIKCNIHAWMSAYVHVFDHPFHDVTGEAGTFEIKGLPPGSYELTAWHEFRRFGPDRERYKVTVESGKATEVVITYSPTKN